MNINQHNNIEGNIEYVNCQSSDILKILKTPTVCINIAKGLSNYVYKIF